MARHLFPKLLPIKSLQRGRYNFNSDYTQTFTINAVDVNNSIFYGQHGYRYGVAASLTNSTTITIRNYARVSGYLNWHVIEFYDRNWLSPYVSSQYPELLTLVKSVQNISGIISMNNSYVDVSINTVDINKTVVFHNGQSTTSSYDLDAYLLNSQTLRILRPGSYTNGQSAHVCIVEFY